VASRSSWNLVSSGQVPDNFLGPGQPTVEPSYIKLVLLVPSLPAAPTVVEMSGPPLHNGVDPWGYPVPMSILVYFDTPIPIDDLFLDDLVIINARWFQYEPSETRTPLRHLMASSGTLQAYWLPVIPTANADIVVAIGENVIMPPGNTVANFTSVFIPPGAVSSPGPWCFPCLDSRRCCKGLGCTLSFLFRARPVHT
jgi:hypothetical protein